MFKEIRKAVHELEKVDPQSPDIVAAIRNLCDIAHTLAQTEIDDAVARGGDPKKIAKAREELGKGEDDYLSSKFMKAVDHYRKAWEKARKA